jgi:hypothetical protein
LQPAGVERGEGIGQVGRGAEIECRAATWPGLDLPTGATTRASVDSSGRAYGPSTDPAIDGDGSAIAFFSPATNLVPGDTNTCGVLPNPGQCPDIFVHTPSQSDVWEPRPSKAGLPLNRVRASLTSLDPHVSGGMGAAAIGFRNR